MLININLSLDKKSFWLLMINCLLLFGLIICIFNLPIVTVERYNNCDCPKDYITWNNFKSYNSIDWESFEKLREEEKNRYIFINTSLPVASFVEEKRGKEAGR